MYIVASHIPVCTMFNYVIAPAVKTHAFRVCGVDPFLEELHQS